MVARQTIVAWAPQGWQGVREALQELQAVCGIRYVESTPPAIPTDTKLFVFGGWHPTFLPLLKKVKEAGIRTAVWFCSSLGQIEFTNYIELAYLQAFQEMLQDKSLDYLLVGGFKIWEPLQDFFPTEQFKMLPFPFNTATYKPLATRIPSSGVHSVGLFANSEPRKNLLNQIAALAIVKDEIRDIALFTNALGIPQQRFAKALGVEFAEARLPNRDQWPEHFAKLALTLQVTFAEVCCYPTMRSLAVGTPCLFSDVVDWARGRPYPKPPSDLVVSRLDDPTSLARRIIHVLNRGESLREDSVRFIEDVAEVSNMLARKCLMEVQGDLN